ncbi:unnamed protein product [Amaranthus hypochondriacus]
MVKGKKDCKKKTKDVQNETIEVVQRDCDPIESTSVLNNNDEETLVVEASSRDIVKRRRKAMPIGITTYCNPGKIVALLNELKCSKPVNLKAVVDIGFGGLLTMKLTKFHRTYPISSSLSVLSLSGPSSKNSTPPVDGEKRVLVYSLPDELETDEEIHAKAGGDDCLKSLLLYKRDVELISSIHLHRLNEVKNKRNDSIRHSNDEGSPILSQTQLTDHDFDLIDKAVAQFSKMNDLIKQMPSFDIFQEVQDFDDVQEDGGIIDDLETVVTNINIVEEIHDKACDNVVDVVEKVQISEDFLCSFCDFDCGPKNVEVKFFSSYLVEHKKQMKCLPQRQQKLMDYVFFVDDKTNLSEDLCSFQKGMTITRENMQTLVASQEIHSSIIETWCFMLNEHVKQNLKSGQDDYRFFFGLSHMIFIPVICDSHYYCVVVNFHLKKIQILDNRKYGAVDELKFSVCAPILVEIIDCIFKEYKCAVTPVSTFNIEIVPFHWKTIRNTRNADSSLFLMLHMFFFKGENFQSDFNEYLRRRLYKVAIGAAIILHPLNTCRLNILQKVEEFNPEKNKRLNDEDKTTRIRVYAKKKSRHFWDCSVRANDYDVKSNDYDVKANDYDDTLLSS